MRRASVALAAGLLFAGIAGAPSFATDVRTTGCDVESATLDWGFKESFRAYIDGSIANGEWTVADGATYETPTFGFPATSGRIDPRLPRGTVRFDGSARFTGHGGILDTTIATPALVVSDQGPTILYLGITGLTMDGDDITRADIPFVTVDLTGQDLTPVDGIITIDAAPTRLTADGEIAFPNYPAGEAFDPLTVTMDVGDCDLSAQPLNGDAEDAPDGTPWLVPAIAAVALLAAAGTVVVLAVRRRSTG